jgi:glycosyltransferase involved in cell wall biosynthesis
MQVTVIYCGHQLDYLYGLVSGFKKQKGVIFKIIDAERDENRLSELASDNIEFLKFLKTKRKGGLHEVFRWSLYYIRLTFHIIFSKSSVYHIEWINRKIDVFEHIYFSIFLKILRKKIIFKVHDIDTNILLNHNKDYKKLKWSMRLFLSKVDSIISHNSYVKSILVDFKIKSEKIHIIAHGINNFQPIHNISKKFARESLGISDSKKVFLFYGNIRSYKGLDRLLESILLLKDNFKDIHLIVAGKMDVSDKKLVLRIEKLIKKLNMVNLISYYPGFIESSETEKFFKASNALVLPYQFIYQSGLPFLSFAMGIPVISTDVGGLSEDIVNNKTGYIIDKDNITSGLQNFLNLKTNLLSSEEIIKVTEDKYNWEEIIQKTIMLYKL